MLKLLLALILSIPASSQMLGIVGARPPSGSTVTVLDVGTKAYQNAVTTKDYTMTVSSGSNRALLLTLNFGAIVSSISATWDFGGTAQTMTQLVLKTTAYSSAVFGLRAPTAGTNLTLRVSWTTTAEVFIAGISFTNVDQTDDAHAFPHTANGSLVSTVSITSAIGNQVVGCETAGTGQGTATGTLIYDDHTSGSLINAMANYDNGASSVTFGNSGLNNNTIAAVDVAHN